MRIYITTSPNKLPVPFNYQQNLVGALHKWLGDNEIHDEISLYSFSWLSGSEKSKTGLNFRNGACWFISSPNIEFIKNIIAGIHEAPEIAFGMYVQEVTLKEVPQFGTKEHFRVASPIFIKRTIGKQIVHYSFEDENVNQLMSETLASKLRKAGLSSLKAKVYFDLSYPKPKTKVITYKGIKNKANLCPIIIEGDSKAIQFAWEVGIGNCTGIGFGALE